MKKLSVLLVAVAVALSASAGVSKLVKSNVNAHEAKAKSELRHQNLNLRGGEAFQGMQLQAFDATARPKTNHALKNGNTLFWDFEDEASVNDWTVWDEDGDGYSWEWTYSEEGGIKTHSGYGCMASASYINDLGPLYPQNWLVSPWIELGGTLGFYACGQDPSYAAEVFTVYVFVNGDYIQISEDITATGRMKAYSFDLSAFEGQEGCVCIVHYNVTDMFRLNVDDITIGEFEPEPEPELPTAITEIPEGCQVYTYSRNSACVYVSWLGIGETTTDGKINVAFDMTNGDVYVQNPSWWHDSFGTWVKGTYDWMTGIITIPTGQYLTYYDDYGYGIVLGWGSTYVYEEEGEYYLGYELDDRTTEIQLMIDDDCLYLLGCAGDVYAEFPESYNATGLMTYYSDDLSMTSLEFANRDEYGYALPWGRILNIVPAVPADPTADDWYDCGDESGYSRFYFTLPNTDVDGNPIDLEHISYSLYIDNGNGPELFHFTGEDYYFDLNPDEDITEVDYALFSNAVDFSASGVYMYGTNMEGYEPLFTENIGVQAFYTVDGIKNASKIAWLYETPEPEDPHMTGYWLVMVQADGTEDYLELQMGTNGDFVNLVDVTYPTFMNIGNFYFLIDGVAYGAAEEGTAAYLGDADENPLTEGNNTYFVENGYSYVLGIHLIMDENTGDLVGYSAYAARGGAVDVEEMNAGKTVASERYFNVAGQEMAQPEGLTIKVTTYTDGTTSTVKVVK
ncbi:MAG: choice-of-anchor J domain-containing protein [Muribaculaceae bacterium]|nr:choice-of-anchor J domain-containing protein [Muribaculaceae bacterium]